MRVILGYVKACRDEMKMRDFEIYRGIYCSLCNALSRNYSLLARLLLSYDFTFAALLRLAVGAAPCTFNQKRCPLDPLKKCWFCDDRAQTDLCAHATVIICYYKLLDDLHDKGIFSKIRAALAFPMISLMHKKAVKLAPGIQAVISAEMTRQAGIEAGNASLDEAADPSASALGKLLSMGYENEEKELMFRLGYMLGRYIYILDAADDLNRDIKSGNFNPFAREFSSLKTENEKRKFAEHAAGILELTRAAVFEAKDAIKINRFDEIAENILLHGLDVSTAKVLGKYTGESTQTRTFTVE